MFTSHTKNRDYRHRLRHLKTIEILKRNNAHRVLDIGFSHGKLLMRMSEDKFFTEIIGVEPDVNCINEVGNYAGNFRRVKLVQDFAENLDESFINYDAITLIEVIEHMRLSKLSVFTKKIFEFLIPRLVIISTPIFIQRSGQKSRTKRELIQLDHFFEWTEGEFKNWVKIVSNTYGYDYKIELLKFPQMTNGTQIGIFTKIKFDR